MQGTPRRRPRPAGRKPERAQRRRARLGQPHHEVEHPVEDDPAARERYGHPVVGPRHPARGEPGDQPAQVARVQRQRLRQGRPRRRRKRLDLARRRHRPRRRAPHRARRPRGRGSRRCGRVAQQRVHQPRQEEPVGRCAVAPCAPPSPCLVVRAEQLARAEEEGRRVLAPCADDVVGGILEPGPQPAGQPRSKRGRARGVAAEQRQDLGPRASVRRALTRRGRPEQRTGCDEDHRCSVPTGCDTPLP